MHFLVLDHNELEKHQGEIGLFGSIVLGQLKSVACRNILKLDFEVVH